MTKKTTTNKGTPAPAQAAVEAVPTAAVIDTLKKRQDTAAKVESDK